MNAVVYLFQASACMGIFYLFYYLLLSRFTFFNINRWYLIVTLALCFIIPLLTITVQQPESYPQVIQKVVYVNSIQNFSPLAAVADLPAETGKTITWMAVIKVLYLIAVGVLFLRLILMVVKFFNRVRNRQRTKIEGVHIVQGDDKISNGSFFNFIFLNDEELSDDELQQIVAHEMLHVKLYHSVDRILVKIAQVFLWFNPFVYLYTRAIEENHEFEVDRAVSSSTDRNKYAELLFHLSVARQGALYHNFSMVPLKKRITMLFTKPTNRMKKVIYLLVVPVVLISCLAFAKIKTEDIKDFNLANTGRQVLTAIKNGQENVIQQLNQPIQLPSISFGVNQDKLSTGSVPPVDDSTINYSAVVGPGSTPFKKDALVKIDGKVYPTTILYEISNKDISGLSVNPLTGEVNLTTKNGRIFYLTAEEKVKIHMERTAYGASKNKGLSPLSLIGDTSRNISFRNVGKDTKLVIDGKEYPHDLLYEISSNGFAAVNLIASLNGKTIDIKTKDGKITYLTALEKDNERKIRTIPDNQFYTRLALTRDNGERYDFIRVRAHNNRDKSSATSEISPDDKIGFKINGQVYSEDELKTISPGIIAYISAVTRGVYAADKLYQNKYKILYTLTTPYYNDLGDTTPVRKNAQLTYNVEPDTKVGDTIVYNLPAYKVEDYARLNHLISILPNSRIANNEVFINNKKIYTVMVDGKISPGGMQEALQFPAVFFDKVEIFNNTAINFVMKQEHKQSIVIQNR